MVFMCNTIVKDDDTKETMLKKMEQINNTEIKEKETEEVTQNQQSKKQTCFQRNQKERNEENVETNEPEKKKLKVRGHPNLSIEVTGDVQAKIEWCNRMQQKNSAEPKGSKIAL